MVSADGVFSAAPSASIVGGAVLMTHVQAHGSVARSVVSSVAVFDGEGALTFGVDACSEVPSAFVAAGEGVDGLVPAMN